MHLTLERIDDFTVVGLAIEHVDIGNAREFNEDIEQVIATNRKVVFDMRRLQFLDSEGIRSLLACWTRIKDAGGEFRVFGLTRPVKTIFELVGMHRIVETFSTKEEALLG